MRSQRRRDAKDEHASQLLPAVGDLAEELLGNAARREGIDDLLAGSAPADTRREAGDLFEGAAVARHDIREAWPVEDGDEDIGVRAAHGLPRRVEVSSSEERTQDTLRFVPNDTDTRILIGLPGIQAVNQPRVRMSARLFAILLLLATLVATPLAAAAPPASPSVLPIEWDRLVYAELGLAQPNLTVITVTGDAFAFRYKVNDKIYDADELGDAYAGSNKYAGEATGDAFVTKMEEVLRGELDEMLTASFPGARVTSVSATVDRSSLVPGSGNRFDPPVHTVVTATVTRQRADVGIEGISDGGLAAAFASGAEVAVDFALTADKGYHTVYSIGAPASPAGLGFAPGEGVSADGRALVASVDNSDGTNPGRSAAASIRQAGVSRPSAEDIRSTIDVTMGDPIEGVEALPMRIHVDSQVRSLDVATRFPGALPAKVALPFVNADGVRALRSSGVLADADVAAANDALLAQVRADVQRAFGGDPTVTGGLSAADMTPRVVATPYTSDTPLTFSAFTNTSYALPGVTGDDIDLAMRIGGTAHVGLNLFSANGRETQFAVHPPTIGVFTTAEGGSVAANGRSATFTVPAGATDHAASVSLRGNDVPDFSEELSEIQITVDLKDLDVSTGKALGGDLGNLVVELTVLGQLSVIEVPDDLKSTLPAKLELTHLSSDAIRLLIDRGYVKAEDLAKLEASLTKTVAEKLGGALGGDIPVTGTFDAASLQVNLVQSPISADEPIVFQATARFLKPMSGGAIEPQAAIALYTTSLPLTLPKIEGRDTVYTIIAPKGLALTGASSGEISQSPDGRDQLTLRPESDSQAVTLSMAVTPGFVFAKFWPLVLLAVVLLVLVIGTPVALVVRSRGKKKKAAAAKK